MPNDQQARRELAKRPKMARYVVSVDLQAKSSFDTREAADKEARRISDAFPILTVHVEDSEEDSVKLFERNLGKDEAEVG